MSTIIDNVAKSIIFILDNNLVIEEITLSDSRQEEYRLISEIKPQEGRLKLADIFEMVWNSHWKKDFKSANTFYFFIGPEAGFTDSRIVHNWLKTTMLFYPDKKYFVDVVTNTTSDFISANRVLLITKAQTRNSQELEYSRQPRIGVKK